MTTTTRTAELHAEIQGHEANAALCTATGRPCDAATHRALANDLRTELRQLEES